MAIFYFDPQAITRGKGRCLTAAVAYIQRCDLRDERQGMSFEYSRARGLLEAGIETPDNAPDWTKDINQLIDRIEEAETRKNSRTGRAYTIALPCEMNNEQRADLLKDFVKEVWCKDGMVAIYGIHEPDKGGDNRNYHAHVILTTRELSGDGFAKHKQREWDKDETVFGWGEKWCEFVRQRGRELGMEIVIESTPPEERGKKATLHLGEQLTAMERKGIKTAKGDYNREAEAFNREIDEKRRELAETQQQLEALLQREAEPEHLPPLELLPEGELALEGELTAEAPALEQVITPEISEPTQEPEPLTFFEEFFDRQRQQAQEKLRAELRQLLEKEEQQPEQVRGHQIPEILPTPPAMEAQEETERLTDAFNAAAQPDRMKETPDPLEQTIREWREYEEPVDHTRQSVRDKLRYDLNQAARSGQPMRTPAEMEAQRQQEELERRLGRDTKAKEVYDQPSDQAREEAQQKTTEHERSEKERLEKERQEREQNAQPISRTFNRAANDNAPTPATHLVNTATTAQERRQKLLADLEIAKKEEQEKEEERQRNPPKKERGMER